jgi:cytochrome c553
MLINKLVTVAIIVLVSAAGSVKADGDAERGQDLINDCIECHGMDGKGNFETPEIAGLDEAYMLKQLRDFYSGKRDSIDGMMHTYTEDRTDQDLQDLAAYWSSVKK